MSELKYKLEKLDLTGTEDNKDIVILKFSDDGTPSQIRSLYAELQSLKVEAGLGYIFTLKRRCTYFLEC